MTPLELGQQMVERGVTYALYTDVNRDGLLQGVNVEATAMLAPMKRICAARKIRECGRKRFMAGGLGNDYIFSGDGNDIIDGGLGNDVLEGGAGNDDLTGGSGDDLFRFDPAAAADGNLGTDHIHESSSGGNDTLDM
jgi:hypothetical protein